MKDPENNEIEKIDDKAQGETIGDTIEKENEEEEVDKYIVYLISINDKSKKEINCLTKIKINKDKIAKIKDIKYYIIDYMKKDFDLCPCLLSISTLFEDGYAFSDVNDSPNKLIKDCIDYFPHGRIYVNVDLKTKCYCGFKELENLSKRDIYEMYIEKINKLNKLIDIRTAEKDEEIKNLEEMIKNIIDNYEKESKLYTKIKNNFDGKLIKFYDVIIDIKSLKDINKGWEIKMDLNGEKRFKEYKDNKALIIGVIGNSNKGKTFLLSKISKIEFPSGTNIKTEGLYIKYAELEKYKNRKIVLLDSAGLETPLLLDKKEKEEILNKNFSKFTIEMNDKLKEKAREKILTEMFLKNFIMYNSDIIIIVVGILTYTEQKFLNRIKEEISKTKLKKIVYIIHNLITYTSKEQVQLYINNNLLNSATFDLEQRTDINTKINSEESPQFFHEIDTDIFHLIFANEGSEAGNYYNNFALEFIEKSYQSITNIESFDVIKLLKKRFIKVSKDLIEKNGNCTSITKDDILDDESIFKEKNFRLKKDNGEIVLKRCFVDELGFSNLRSNGFNPFYNVYKKENKIILKFETPGNVSLSYDCNIQGSYNIITIKGQKKLDKDIVNDKDNIINNREFGEFTIKIPLRLSEYRLSNESPKIQRKEGITCIEYGLCNNSIIHASFYVDTDDEI
jgi:HSP20 family molecular chaperone IbpA